MGGACGTYGVRGEVYTGIRWRNLRKRDYLENVGIDGRTVLRCIIRKWNVGHGLE